jgi:predicted dehydrogenase
MSRLRVGIVGCGEVTQILHLPSLYQLNHQFEVTALCDISPTTLNDVGDVWGIQRRYSDYHELISDSEIDVVLVANPNIHHAETILAAARAGKHVLVEKPMCVTLEEADSIIDTERETGVTIQVGYMRRYAPAFVAACKRVAALDNIRFARIHDFLGENHQFSKPTSRVIRGDDIPAAVRSATGERSRRNFEQAIGSVPAALNNAYGLLLGLGSHDLSAMREILGVPHGVLYAAQRTDGRYMSAAFDYGDFVCHYETGIDKIARFDACIEVFGVTSVIRVDYDTPYVRNLPITLTVTEAEGDHTASVKQSTTWGDPFVVEWQAFYDNVTQRLVPKSSPQDSREDLLLFSEMIRAMSRQT